jgi:hypothetical protein
MYSDGALSAAFAPTARSVKVGFFRELPRVPERRVPIDNRFERGGESASNVRPPSGDRLHDETLDRVRGLTLGVLLGLGCWLFIGLTARALLF